MADPKPNEILLRITADAPSLEKTEEKIIDNGEAMKAAAREAEKMGLAIKNAADVAEIRTLTASIEKLTREIFAAGNAERAAADQRRAGAAQATAQRRQEAEARTAERRAAADANAKAKEEARQLAVTEKTAAAEAKRVAEEAKKIKAPIEQAKEASDKMGFSFASALKTIAGLAAINFAGRAVKNFFKETIMEGVQFNAQLEQAQLGIGSVLKTFYPERYATFNDAIRASGMLISKLKDEAKRTSAGFSQLLESYQGTAGAMASANVPMEKQVKLASDVAKAMSALGIPLQEMRQESVALLEGRIDRNSRLANTLQITAEDIQRERSAGTLYDFLAAKLKNFSDAASLAETNINILQANLRDNIQFTAAESTEQLTEAYRELLIALTNLTNSDSFKLLLTGLAASAGKAAEIVTSLVEAVTINDPADIQLATAVDTSNDVNAIRTDEDAERMAKRVKTQLDAARNAYKHYREELKGDAEYQRATTLFGSVPSVDAEFERLAQQIREYELLMRRVDGAKAIIQGNQKSDAENKIVSDQESSRRAAQTIIKGIADPIRSGEKVAALEFELTTNEQKLKLLDQQTAAAYRLHETQSDAAELMKDEVAMKGADIELSLTLLTIAKNRESVQKAIATDAKKEADETERKANAEAKAAKEAASRDLRTQESQFAAKLAEIDRERAQSQANAYLTTGERRQETIRLLGREREAIEAIISSLRRRIEMEADPAAREAIQQRLDTYSGRLSQNDSSIFAAEAGPARGIQRFNTELRQMGEDGDAAFDIINAGFNGMTSGIVEALQSAKSLGDGFKKVFAAMGNAILQAIQQLIAMRIAMSVFSFLGIGVGAMAGGAGAAAGGAAGSGAVSIGGGIGDFGATPAVSFGGFADGGFTGLGGRNEPAGIVHRGEFVFNQEAVRSIGLKRLEAIHSAHSMPGYADGGYVGADPVYRDSRSGGDTLTFNYSFEAGVTRQEVAALIPVIEQRVTAAVEDKRRRGKN